MIEFVFAASVGVVATERARPWPGRSLSVRRLRRSDWRVFYLFLHAGKLHCTTVFLPHLVQRGVQCIRIRACMVARRRTSSSSSWSTSERFRSNLAAPGRESSRPERFPRPPTRTVGPLPPPPPPPPPLPTSPPIGVGFHAPALEPTVALVCALPTESESELLPSAAAEAAAALRCALESAAAENGGAADHGCFGFGATSGDESASDSECAPARIRCSITRVTYRTT